MDDILVFWEIILYLLVIFLLYILIYVFVVWFGIFLLRVLFIDLLRMRGIFCFEFWYWINLNENLVDEL